MVRIKMGNEWWRWGEDEVECKSEWSREGEEGIVMVVSDLVFVEEGWGEGGLL